MSPVQLAICARVHGSCGSTRIQTRATYLLFTGNELQIDVGARNFTFTPTEPFVGTGRTRAFTVPEHTSVNKSINYRKLVSMVTGKEIDDALITSVKRALVITLIDLQPDSDELVTANNQAIEIAQLNCA